MRTCILFALLLGAFSGGFSQAPSFGVFEPSEYASRRARLMDQIPDGIAVIQGATGRSDYYRFFQNNDFMYLCGLEIPDAVLVIDGVKRESTIFFTLDERGARNEGIPLEVIGNREEVRRTWGEVTGLDAHLELGELEGFLKGKTGIAKNFYTEFYPEELNRECSMEKFGSLQRSMSRNPRDGRATREEQFINWLKKLIPSETSVKDCSRMIWDLRSIKSPAEIELLRRAGKIGVEAHKALMKATRVGQPEYELAALFEYENKKRGAQELAYYTIICAGENHPYLHYHSYDGTLKDGDFLVIDGGPDFHYYDIDITISYPVNGTFTARQKEIYAACNAIHEACMAVYRPGISYSELPGEVENKLQEMGWDPNLPILKKFGASFGHYVGMAVHDVGGGPRKLEVGMVFANEPLAVFMEENLGVRVEDTIVITEEGCENLTAGIPRTVEEIEAFMAK